MVTVSDAEYDVPARTAVTIAVYVVSSVVVNSSFSLINNVLSSEGANSLFSYIVYSVPSIVRMI